jgi:hypothetical protein
MHPILYSWKRLYYSDALYGIFVSMCWPAAGWVQLQPDYAKKEAVPFDKASFHSVAVPPTGTRAD